MLACSGAANATDIAGQGNWSSLASDRVAHNVGDVLTVVVYENATATGTAENTTDRSNSLGGQLSAGTASSLTSFGGSANLGLSHTADSGGTTTRAGNMVGEISVTIDSVLPNGDLHVAGTQVLNINGEKTRIAVKGEVRTADVSPSNIILSTSLANATIDYDGAGIVSQSSKPGILTRVFNWLGLP
jgi:flagellar L-ring protein precursor FlgH